MLWVSRETVMTWLMRRRFYCIAAIGTHVSEIETWGTRIGAELRKTVVCFANDTHHHSMKPNEMGHPDSWRYLDLWGFSDLWGYWIYVTLGVGCFRVRK